MWTGSDLLNVGTPFLVLSTLILSMRLATRFLVVKKPGIDDLLLTLAWAFNVVIYSGLFRATKMGVGHHISELSLKQISRIFKMYLFGTVCYLLSLALAKLSIFYQYTRLFVIGSWTLKFSYAGLILVAVNLIWSAFLTIFMCNPVHKSWDIFAPGYCLNVRSILLAYAVTNIFTSFFALVLPIPAIMSLKIPLRTKLLVILLFAFGTFDVFLSIVRLKAVDKTFFSLDPTYEDHAVAIWSILECNVSIICCAAPALRPLIKRFAPSFMLMKNGSDRGGGQANQGLENHNQSGQSASSKPKSIYPGFNTILGTDDEDVPTSSQTALELGQMPTVRGGRVDSTDHARSQSISTIGNDLRSSTDVSRSPS